MCDIANSILKYKYPYDCNYFKRETGERKVIKNHCLAYQLSQASQIQEFNYSNNVILSFILPMHVGCINIKKNNLNNVSELKEQNTKDNLLCREKSIIQIIHNKKIESLKYSKQIIPCFNSNGNSDGFISKYEIIKDTENGREINTMGAKQLYAYKNKNCTLNTSDFQIQNETNETVIEVKKDEIGSFNNSLQNGRHKSISFNQEFKLIKIDKVLSCNEEQWQHMYVKAFSKSNKLAIIKKHIDHLKRIYSATNERKPHNRIKTFESVEELNKYNNFNIAKSEMKIERIKSDAFSSMNINCVFRHCFSIRLDITELFIDDLLSKQHLIFLCNYRNHSRISVKMNDYIIDEGEARGSKILVESHSKIELIQVLDIVNRVFPGWEIWKNGTLIN